ncbi:ATP-dependent RNA helicase DEAH12-like protein [Lachnellula subtilissima]|uniref:RBR-type E3 ubiquitin transferase n=1 Tax=Lachnellula subtilissima TaxID=602034 RepID=A0A8H8RHR2_9HELO|nr:ATP-dependent RNA helicase DEAH12-like protein [Lachnellula subtilissima]
MAPCIFFRRGACMNGDSCKFTHERDMSNQRDFGPVRPGFPDIERLAITSAKKNVINKEVKSKLACRFFSQGSCNKGDGCRYVHAPTVTPPEQVHSDTNLANPSLDSPSGSSLPKALDSRAEVACSFMSRPGGCQKDSCPYLHTANEHGMEISATQDIKDQDLDDDLSRNILGAMVKFNEVGHVLKVSFPTDFSLTCIQGFRPDSSPEAIVDIVRGLGFDVTTDCVRILKSATVLEPKATVKVEDPLFATELCSRLKDQGSALNATPISIAPRQTNCRKVHISWHKSTRSAWLNFGNGEIAKRVAQKFNKGKYKCLGQSIRSSAPSETSHRWGRGGFRNSVPWTIILSDVPGHATSKDIEAETKILYDKPRHIELGASSYDALDAEVSVMVRSQLEEHGPLELFHLAPSPEGKRVKAIAWFVDEEDARSACDLNNRPLDILKMGRLTVTLVPSAKIKVSTPIYLALKTTIDDASMTWKERHLRLRFYQDAISRFTTMKVEGDDAKDVASARKTLDDILRGVVLTDGQCEIGSSLFSSNRSAHNKLKAIERELRIVIIGDKTKRCLLYHGPPEKMQRVVRQITDILKEESLSNFEISLYDEHQFSWTIHGGFKSMVQELGKDVAVFDVVSRKIIINGTQQQFYAALSMMNGEYRFKTYPLSEHKSEGECPICLATDDIDMPVETSCKHTYCLECFESCCKHAASTSTNQFQIICAGDGGECGKVFDLAEVKKQVSSAVFEDLFKSSFKEYIGRHPQDFHYCKGVDCGFVYRCTSAANSKPPLYACSNCPQRLCTSCHENWHGGHTCAEYKDLVSGGYEALEKVKKELNIKACPKCKTLMEKTEGCNHMSCLACRAHICWVCMAAFETSKPCYDHMFEKHGSIGLGLEHFAY